VFFDILCYNEIMDILKKVAKEVKTKDFKERAKKEIFKKSDYTYVSSEDGKSVDKLFKDGKREKIGKK